MVDGRRKLRNYGEATAVVKSELSRCLSLRHWQQKWRERDCLKYIS